MSSLFVTAWNQIAAAAHANSQSHGWWDAPDWIADFAKKAGLTLQQADQLATAAPRNDGELLALIHSEASEALEALRDGNPPCEKAGCESFTQAEVELADVVIRIMDMAAFHGWDIAGAVEAKHAYNLTRAHKHGGRLF